MFPTAVGGLPCIAKLHLAGTGMFALGLEQLTALQDLALSSGAVEDDQDLLHWHLDNSAQLQDALPSLQQLKSLEVQGVVCGDAPLSNISALQHLEQLILHDAYGQCTSSTLAALPASITDLTFNGPVYTLSPWEPLKPRMFINANTPASLISLTALQQLHLGGCMACDIDVLTNITSLAHLGINRNVQYQPGFNGRINWSVVSTLTNLQYLSLAPAPGLLAAAARDVAACTASTQLTYLCLCGDIAGDKYSTVFPAGRLLPALKHAALGAVLLATSEVIYNMASCCPNLQNLELYKRRGPPSADLPGPQTGAWKQGLLALGDHTALTRLRLCSNKEEPLVAVDWQALGTLTQLSVLELATGRSLGGAADLLGLLHLTSLHNLQAFSVEEGVVPGYGCSYDVSSSLTQQVGINPGA